jgi:hypothetical protein
VPGAVRSGSALDHSAAARESPPPDPPVNPLAKPLAKQPNTERSAEPVALRRPVARTRAQRVFFASQEEPDMTPVDTRVVVEDDVPLSRSILWDLQRRFYMGRGPEAWGGGEVPSWITSNPLMAAFYAELVVAWAIEGLRTSPPRIRTDEPVVILELGAGPGMLGHRFLTRLVDLEEIWRPTGLSFRYVMTDLVPANVAFWKDHPRLAPFFASGLLSVARFDPLNDGAAVYPEGQRPIVAGSTLNPIVVLANYFFDSIPTDLIRVGEGTAWRAHLTTTAPTALEPRPDPSVISDLEHTWTWREYDEAPYGGVQDELVQFYTDALEEAHFPFPVGGFATMEVLDELSAGRMLLLTADKGANDLQRFGGTEHQNIVRHGDGFSFDANPDAIARWAVAKGGFALHNGPLAPLSITAIVLGAARGDCTSTQLMWRHHTDARDPSEFYPHLKGFIDGDAPTTGRHLLTLLRESAWDPYILSTLQRKAAGKIRKLGERDRNRLVDALRRTWRNYYHLGEKQDVPFLFGTVAFEVEAWEDARTWFEASVELHGRAPAALHNIGLTLAKVDRWAEALPWFDAALAEKSDYAPAVKFAGLARRVVDAERVASLAEHDEAAVPAPIDDAAPDAGPAHIE